MIRPELAFFAGLLTATAALAADQKVPIRFQAMVGKETFACGLGSGNPGGRSQS